MAAVLRGALADTLVCPSCRASAWIERPATIECGSCGRHWLVVSSIPVLLSPVPATGAGPEVDAVLRAALGRFHDLLGGLQGTLAWVRQEPLERAFEVPGASWISLERYGWPKSEWWLEAYRGEGPALDLGCGYGPSSIGFVSGGAGRTVIGLDENLFFLLLFQRYLEAKQLAGVALACHAVGEGRLPLRDGAVADVTATSFFNHFACLRSRRELREFFAETARVLRPGGRLVMNMVPNRGYPFPAEINLDQVVLEPRLRALATRVAGRLPLRWLPGRVTVPAIWAAYRLYSAARGRAALGLAEFKSEIGKALPESALNGLPVSARGYGRLARAFARVEAFDEWEPEAAGPIRRASLRPSYFLLRCTR